MKCDDLRDAEEAIQRTISDSYFTPWDDLYSQGVKGGLECALEIIQTMRYERSK